MLLRALFLAAAVAPPVSASALQRFSGPASGSMQPQRHGRAEALKLALASPAPAAPAATRPPDHLLCRETSGGRQWKVDFDWPHETSTVYRRAAGAKDWDLLFRNAAAVHVFEAAGTVLVETSLKDWVGPTTTDHCGQRIETLFFDVSPHDGHFEGTVEVTPHWQGRDDDACGPAPEEAAAKHALSCDAS